MSDDTVEVRIIGVDQLSPAFKAASSSVADNTSLMRAALESLGVAGRATAGDLQTAGRMIADGWSPATAAATAAASSLSTVSTAARGTATAVTGLSVNVPVATRELRALFDEISSGRTRMLPGTLAILAQRVFGLGPAALVATGGIAALVGGIGYLAYQAMESAEALRALNAAAVFQGVDVAGAELEELVNQIEKVTGASRDEATAVMRAFMGMKNATVPLIREMIDQLGTYITATGEKAPEAAKKLAAAFGDPIAKGEEFLRSIKANREALNQFNQAAQRGDAVAALVTMLTELTEKLAAVRAVQDTVTDSQREAVEELDALGGAEMGAARAADQVAAAVSKIDSSRIAQLARDFAAATSAAKEFYNTHSTGAPLSDVSENIQAERAKMEATGKTNAEILAMERKTWADRIAVGDLSGKELTRAQTEQYRAQAQAQRAGGQALIEDTRDQIAKIDSETRKGENTRSAETVAAWKKLLGDQRLTADQRKEVERDYYQSIAQLHSVDAGAGHKAMESQLHDLEAVAQEAKRGSEERILADGRWLTAAINAGKQYQEQQRSASKALVEDLRAEQQARAEIARATGQADIEIANKSLGAAKDALSAEFQAHEITAAKENEQLKQLAAQKYAMDLQALDNELATLEAGTAEYQRAFEQRRVLAAQYTLDQAVLLRQFTEQTKEELQKQVEAYKSAFREIDEAVGTFFRDFASGQKSASQAALEALRAFMTKFISDLAEMALKFAAFELAQEIGWKQIAGGIAGGDKVGGVGGLVGGALGLGTPSNAGMSASTAQFATAVTLFQSAVAQMAGRSAAEGLGGGAGVFGMGGAASGSAGADSAAGLAGTPELESAITDNTAATTANSGGILQWAAQAVMAAAAWIANTIATIENTVVTGAEGLIPHAAGAWNLASDESAYLHAGEMVIPSGPASIMRRMAPNASFTSLAAMVQTARMSSPFAGLSISGASAVSGLSLPAMPQFAMPEGSAFGGGGGSAAVAGGGGNTFNFHIAANDGPSVQAFFNKNARTIARTIQTHLRTNPSDR